MFYKESIFWGFNTGRSIGARISHLGYLLLGWLQNLEWTNQILVATHQGSRVIELSTVVRSWKYSYQLSLSKKLISLFDNLMSPTNQIKFMFFTKHLNQIWPKGEWHSSFILAPSLSIFVWIWPKKITKKS